MRGSTPPSISTAKFKKKFEIFYNLFYFIYTEEQGGSPYSLVSIKFEVGNLKVLFVGKLTFENPCKQLRNANKCAQPRNVLQQLLAFYAEDYPQSIRNAFYIFYIKY